MPLLSIKVRRYHSWINDSAILIVMFFLVSIDSYWFDPFTQNWIYRNYQISVQFTENVNCFLATWLGFSFVYSVCFYDLVPVFTMLLNNSFVSNCLLFDLAISIILIELDILHDINDRNRITLLFLNYHKPIFDNILLSILFWIFWRNYMLSSSTSIYL